MVFMINPYLNMMIFHSYGAEAGSDGPGHHGTVAKFEKR